MKRGMLLFLLLGLAVVVLAAGMGGVRQVGGCSRPPLCTLRPSGL